MGRFNSTVKPIFYKEDVKSKSIFFNWLILEREKGRDWGWGKHRFTAPFIYAFSGCFLYVHWRGIKLTALVYWDDTVNNWATQPGPNQLSPNQNFIKDFDITWRDDPKFT